MTQKEVAQHLGISQVTVSYALNKPDSRKCSPALRKKIRDYCQKHAPGLLRSGKSFQIALAIVKRKLEHSFYQPAVEGVREKAKESDYQVIVTEPAKIGELYQKKKFDGLISVAPLDDYKIFTKDLPENLPQVMINDYLPELDINSVMPDYLSGSYQVIKHLYETGHRRISGLFISRIGFKKINAHFVERESAFYYYLEKFGFSKKYCRHIEIPNILSPDLIPYFTNTINSFPKDEFPDAFFLGDGYVPFWIRALNLKGYTVPEDISIIGFDNSRETVLETGLTSLDFSLKKSGMQAFQLLYNEICSGIQNNIRINIKPKLIIRNTVSRRKS